MGFLFRLSSLPLIEMGSVENPTRNVTMVLQMNNTYNTILFFKLHVKVLINDKFYLTATKSTVYETFVSLITKS